MKYTSIKITDLVSLLGRLGARFWSFVGSGGNMAAAGRRYDLPVSPHVHVVAQRGRRLDGGHDRYRDSRHITVLVADVAADVAAEVGPVRACRAAQSLQLLRRQTSQHHYESNARGRSYRPTATGSARNRIRNPSNSVVYGYTT